MIIISKEEHFMRSFVKLVSIVLLFAFCFIALGGTLVNASSTVNISASSLVDTSNVQDSSNVNSASLTVSSGAYIVRLISLLLPLIGILGTVIIIIIFIVKWVKSDSEKKILLKEKAWIYIVSAVILFFGGMMSEPILKWIMLMSSRG